MTNTARPPTAGRFKKLRELQCFDEVDRRIRDGWPLRSVATFIQDECGEYTDVGFQSLVVVLSNYRNALPPEELVRNTLPDAFGKAIEKVKSNLDAIDEMENSYWIERERIEKAYEIEKTTEGLSGGLSKEIMNSVAILEKMANLRMDLGIDKRHLGDLNVDARLMAHVQARYGRMEILNVINSPASRRKVEGVLQRVLSIPGGIDLVKAEFGETVIDAETVPVRERESKSQEVPKSENLP